MLKGSEYRKTGRKRRRSTSKSGRLPGQPNDFLTSEAYEAFIRLRNAFLKASVLMHFDSSKLIRVETDAFDKALGAILYQQNKDGHWHSVAYNSRKLIPAKRNYETHDKELLAIVYAFKVWRHYLQGARHDILILTDHRNLSRFITTTSLSQRQVRWAQKLSKYHFKIDYWPEVKNSADELSRRPDFMDSTSVNFEENRTILGQLQDSLRRGRDFELTSSEKVKFVETGLVFELLKAVPTKTFERRLASKKELSTTVQVLSARSLWDVTAKTSVADWSSIVLSKTFEEWKVLMCGIETISDIAVRNVLIAEAMIEEEAYRSESASSLVDLIRFMLLEDVYTAHVLKELTTPSNVLAWEMH